jgi:hypothetical protein
MKLLKIHVKNVWEIYNIFRLKMSTIYTCTNDFTISKLNLLTIFTSIQTHPLCALAILYSRYLATLKSI